MEDIDCGIVGSGVASDIIGHEFESYYMQFLWRTFIHCQLLKWRKWSKRDREFLKTKTQDYCEESEGGLFSLQRSMVWVLQVLTMAPFVRLLI